MRNILFRGKTNKGEWVEGFYYKDLTSNCVYIISWKNANVLDVESFVEVIPETIGQYTGLTDKNGTKIFEGDIILWGLAPCVAKYDIENARFMFYENGKYLKNGFNKDTMEMKEVIGNIHDNGELLGGK